MILRIELRRSIALWAGAAVLVVALGVLYGFAYGPWWQGTAAWTAQWTSAARWERQWLTLLWPIAVGAGALQGLREHRSGMRELLSTASRPAWQPAARTAGAVGITMVAAYLLVFAVPVVYLVAGGVRPFHLGWVAIVVIGAVSLVAGAWIGLGIGRTLPHVLTPPAAAVIALVLSWFGAASDEGASLEGRFGRFPMLMPGGTAASDPFVTIAGAVHLAQTTALLGLAATGFMLVVAANLRTRLIAALPLVIGVTIGTVLLPPSVGGMYVQDQEATALICSGPVCVTAMHESKLAALAGPGQEALQLLAALPDAPTSVHETTVPRWQERANRGDVVQVGLGDPEFVRATPAEQIWIMVAGAGTFECQRPGVPVWREQAARAVSAAYFVGELRPVPGFSSPTSVAEIDRLAGPAWTALRALPADEQKARIVALREAELSCQGVDPLAILTR